MIIPILKSGKLDLQKFNIIIKINKVKFISITHISNVLGNINPIKYLIKKSNNSNIIICIDAAQSIQHLKTNVNKLNCDFFVFSSHKMYGPFGIGILYGKQLILKNMIPYQTGGNMILYFDKNNIFYNKIPYKFESGTQSISNVVSFSKTIDFLNTINFKIVKKYDFEILKYAKFKLTKILKFKIIGNIKQKYGILSFIIDEIHSHDIGDILNQYGIAIRTGHHCAILITKFYNVSSVSRISLCMYNTLYEIDKIYFSINNIKNFFII